MAQPDSSLSAVTTELITSYGITLKNLVHAYRVSGERMAEFLEQRWTAVELAPAPLSPELKRGARAARAVVGSVYYRGLALTTDSAESLLDKMVELTNQSVLQAAATASRFEAGGVGVAGVAGVAALAPLAQVARASTPAAAAAAALANRVEAASGTWAEKLASAAEAAPAVKRRSAFAKARARQAA